MSIWSTLAGMLTGGLGTALGGIGSSALNYAASLSGLKKQYGYNTKLQKQSYTQNSKLQKQAYNYSKQLQQFQNDYETMMSNSAHQREVADLRAAGLNPILSANNGASTPSAGGAIIGSGSVGSGSVGLSDLGSPGSAIDTMLSIKGMKNQTAQTESNIDLNETQKELNDSSSWLNRKTASLRGEEARNEAEKFKNIVEERDRIKSETEWNRQNILNSIGVTAATIDKMRKDGDAALMNAYAAGVNASANDYKAKNWSMGYHGSVENKNVNGYSIKLPFGLGGWSVNTDRSKSYGNTY